MPRYEYENESFEGCATRFCVTVCHVLCVQTHLWWVIALLWLRGMTLLRGVVSLALLVIVTGSAAAVLILRGSTVRHVDIGGNKGRLLGKC